MFLLKLFLTNFSLLFKRQCKCIMSYHVSEDNVCQKKDITLHQMCLQIDDRNKESLEFAGRFSSIILKNVMFQKWIAFVSSFQKNKLAI